MFARLDGGDFRVSQCRCRAIIQNATNFRICDPGTYHLFSADAEGSSPGRHHLLSWADFAREIAEENGWRRSCVGEGTSGHYLDLQAATPNERRGAWGTGRSITCLTTPPAR